MSRGVPNGTVRIFDTTLRDGEQAPGAGLTAAEKLEVARQLARLRVDVIEAGFPAASSESPVRRRAAWRSRPWRAAETVIPSARSRPFASRSDRTFTCSSPRRTSTSPTSCA